MKESKSAGIIQNHRVEEIHRNRVWFNQLVRAEGPWDA